MLTQLNPKIQQRLALSSQELATFCKEWGIIEMSLFGSVLRDDFHENSDIDFLITFDPNVRQGLLTLAHIKNELESLLKRPVDLVSKKSIETSENWIRRREILSNYQTFYKLADHESFNSQ